jgi:hypothetical protein
MPGRDSTGFGGGIVEAKLVRWQGWIVVHFFGFGRNHEKFQPGPAHQFVAAGRRGGKNQSGGRVHLEVI